MKKNKKYQIFDKGNINWYFFPIVGLHIKPFYKWRQFLFHDATIVNGKDIAAYMNKIEFNKSHIVDKDNLKHQFPESTTFVIVKVCGKITNTDKDEFDIKAIKRANQVAALIYFVFLYSSYYKYGVSLEKEVFQSMSSDYIRFQSSGGWGYTTKRNSDEHLISIPSKSFNLTRNQLEKFLFRRQFRQLKHVIINPNIQINEVILNSLVYFYLTTNSMSVHSQFIGSVTAMEILLNFQGDKYNLIEKRAQILIGVQYYEMLIKEEREDKSQNINKGVFKKRHNVIHEGELPDSIDSFRAIKLFSYILISYSILSIAFNSKGEICKFIDWIFRYKHDSNFKNDQFGLTKWYDENIINFEIFDWRSRSLIYWNGLCAPEVGEMKKYNFANAVHSLCGFKQIGLKFAYEEICSNVYYHEIPFKDFEEFNLYLDDVKEQIEQDRF